MKFSNISLRARLFRGAAALLALLTAQMLWTNLRAIEQQAHSLGPAISVVLAARDLPIGLIVTAADMRTVIRHESQMPANTVRDPAAAVGAVVRIGIVKDAPIQTRSLVTAQHGNRSIVPVGFRALRVADHAGLVVRPGSVVDIIASYASVDGLEAPDSGARLEGSTSIVVARGALVMVNQDATSSRVTKSRGGDTSDAAVIVRVKEGDVTAITFAQSFGVVSIVLAPLENACCE